MKFIITILVCMISINTSAGLLVRCQAYAITNGVTYSKNLAMHIGVLEENGQETLLSWNIEGVNQPAITDLPTEIEAVAIVEAARQASKTPIHKLADNATIDILISAGYVPIGTTALTNGTYEAVALQLLQAEIASPTNTALMTVSSKLDRLKSVIDAEGGNIDDAIKHP